MKTPQSCIDPSELTPADMENVERLLASLNQNHPKLVGSDGETIEMPECVYQLLRQVLSSLRAGKAMFLIPTEECFTTQAAANFLGVSRPFFVQLLEGAKLPFHMVGSHRRVYFKDLLEYNKERSAHRRKTLDELTDFATEHGLEDRDEPVE